MKFKKATVIIQARMSSTRLPKKVLKKIGRVTVIESILNRLKYTKRVDKIIIAIPNSKKDNFLYNFLLNRGFNVFRGSEKNVLDRYLKASKKYNCKNIVRITGDCPFIDPKLIDYGIFLFFKKKVDYLSNIFPPTFPNGLDFEIFTKKTLETISKKKLSHSHKEHVTSYIRDNHDKFKIFNFKNKIDLSSIRLTLDTKNDLLLLKKVSKYFGNKINFDWKKILNNKILLKKLKIKFSRNNKLKKLKISSGQKLWNKAKKIIPGGNMLLSKRGERFLPKYWPNYFIKAKKCFVWDLNKKKYTDMSLMGVGTNILGYSNKKIDNAVSSVAKKGNMSTLNCPEEVYLSEKLISIHPWSEMVKLFRSGGEANAAAIRIARAATGKEKVLVCGYHGWHDWYLATNLSNKKNLDKMLVSGVSPLGVPKKLIGSTKPFNYNNIFELKKLISKNKNICAVKMEVERNIPQSKGFLRKVRSLTKKKNILLIFDECTSGFRENYGGLHMKYKVYPDIAIFGKALGNGYAINAIIGKKKYMKFADLTFMSSTFWTERIGPTAAIKTLEEMKRIKSWNIISSKGGYIKKNWKIIADKYNVQINIFGLNSLCGFNFKSKNSNLYKTLITQEMMKRGFLASNMVYVCTEHTKKIIDNYLKVLDEIFYMISECEKSHQNINNLLETNQADLSFKRLN